MEQSSISWNNNNNSSSSTRFPVHQQQQQRRESRVIFYCCSVRRKRTPWRVHQCTAEAINVYTVYLMYKKKERKESRAAAASIYYRCGSGLLLCWPRVGSDAWLTYIYTLLQRWAVSTSSPRSMRPIIIIIRDGDIQSSSASSWGWAETQQTYSIYFSTTLSGWNFRRRRRKTKKATSSSAIQHCAAVLSFISPQ